MGETEGKYELEGNKIKISNLGQQITIVWTLLDDGSIDTGPIEGKIKKISADQVLLHKAANGDIQSLSTLKKNGDEGQVMAQIYLANLYQNGGPRLQQDLEEARKWIQKGAAQGNAVAKAANQGDEWAQVFLGDMNRFGVGAPKNIAEAVKWYRKAADQGNASAKNALVGLHAS